MMDFIKHMLLPQKLPSGAFQIDYLRVNEWRWNGLGINQLVIPQNGKVLIEITGTGQLRVFRA